MCFAPTNRHFSASCSRELDKQVMIRENTGRSSLRLYRVFLLWTAGDSLTIHESLALLWSISRLCVDHPSFLHFIPEMGDIVLFGRLWWAEVSFYVWLSLFATAKVRTGFQRLSMGFFVTSGVRTAGQRFPIPLDCLCSMVWFFWRKCSTITLIFDISIHFTPQKVDIRVINELQASRLLNYPSAAVSMSKNVATQVVIIPSMTCSRYSSNIICSTKLQTAHQMPLCLTLRDVGKVCSVYSTTKVHDFSQLSPSHWSSLFVQNAPSSKRVVFWNDDVGTRPEPILGLQLTFFSLSVRVRHLRLLHSPGSIHLHVPHSLSLWPTCFKNRVMRSPDASSVVLHQLASV